MNDMERDLAQLPDPQPPSSLAPNIMARVSRIEERVHVRSTDRSKAVRPLAVALVGLAIVVVSWLAGKLAPRSLFDLVSSWMRDPNLEAMLPHALALVAVAFGLLLYLAGVFAPLRDRR